jgi:hypothetical protein
MSRAKLYRLARATARSAGATLTVSGLAPDLPVGDDDASLARPIARSKTGLETGAERQTPLQPFERKQAASG